MPATTFGVKDLTIDEATREIRRSGKLLAAEPKIFDLLLFLIRNRDRVVGKNELLDELWEGRFVGEAVLARAVCQVRKLLGDQKAIRTSYGRGYRFVASAVEVGSRTVDTALARPDERAHHRSSETRVARPQGQIPGMVGRQSEVSRLESVLDRLSARVGGLALVTGEAGIGKTRLLEEVQRLAEARAMTVEWGRCPEAIEAPAFWPWLQVFESRGVGPTGLTDTSLGAATTMLTTSSEEHDRFRQFDFLSRQLFALARTRPTVVLLDDLHRADLSSLLFLEFLCGAIAAEPLVIVGAYREVDLHASPAKEQVFARLIRRADPLVMDLTGLSESEIAEFLAGKIESSVLKRAATVLHDVTSGNPFFLRQLVLALDVVNLEQGNLTVRILPSSVRDAIARQLEGLTDECRELLSIAAVAGREFDVQVVARASGRSLAEAICVLDAALEARVVGEVGSSPTRYRFGHVLVRDVLYHELAPGSRARLHQLIGRAIEVSYPHRRDEQLTSLAYHFYQSAQIGDAESAADYAVEVGARALRELAYEDAARYFSQAVRALELCTEPDLPSLCAVLLDLGTAYARSGAREEAAKTFDQATALCRKIGAADALARVALELAPGVFAIEFGVYDEHLITLLREALAAVGKSDGALRALLLARLSAALYWSQEASERSRAANEAWELAEAQGNASVWANISSMRLAATWGPDDLEARRELARRAVEHSEQAGERELLPFNRLLSAAIELEAVDLAGYRREMDAFERLVEKGNQPQAQWMVRASRGLLALLEGRLREVEQETISCLTIGQRIKDNTALQTFGVQLALLRIEQGRASEVIPAVEDFQERYPRVSGWEPLLAYLLAESGRTADARRIFKGLSAKGFSFPRDVAWMTSMAFASEACALLGEASSAERLMRLLMPFADRVVVVGFGAACLGSVKFYLGILATTAGRTDEAAAYFESAMEIDGRVGAIALALRAQVELAKLLRERGDRADLVRAERLTGDALAKADRQGLHRLKRRILEQPTAR